MCGIAGIKRYGEAPITLDQIRLLLCSLQHRGADATGMALMTKGRIAAHKDDIEAWKYVGTKGFLEFIEANLTPETETAILHTRSATGNANPRDTKNNHPLTSNKSAIVHNGTIENHSVLFDELKVPKLAETDSDVIRAFVDVYGITPEAIKQLGRMKGSCAAACLSTEYPDKLLILRSGSPLVLSKVGDHLIWASEKNAIHIASKPWGKWRGLYVQEHASPMSMVASPKDSGWIFGPEGLEYHGEFRSCNFYTKPDYTRVRTEYRVRQAKWDGEWAAKHKDVKKPIKYQKGGEDYYICRNEKCRCAMAIPPAKKETPLYLLHCPQCTWTVEEVDMKVVT